MSLKNALRYDPISGHLFWRVRRGRARVGAIAGYIQTNGDKTTKYVAVRFKGKEYAAHRVAVFLMTGVWPTKLVDHRDGDGTNNKWGNLRQADHSQNGCNRSVSHNNSVGLKGVYPCGNKYGARITKNKRRYFLGYFTSPKAAHVAYLNAAKQLHGQFMKG
jgi:hypothetical protein